jgi:hypothetical protein
MPNNETNNREFNDAEDINYFLQATNPAIDSLTATSPNLSTSTFFFDTKILGETGEGSVNAAAGSITANDGLVINPQVLPEGFGSYLQNILPDDIAVTAGSFACTMQQVKNITTIPAEKFAQIVASIETTQGLDLVNGTNVPTAISEVENSLPLIALGSGPYGMYTYSDFYGCMSGLPYPWQQLQTLIQNIQTSKLASIYNQLYLSTSWKGATVSVQYTTYVVVSTTYYTVTGLTLTNAGGGYGRAGAPSPTITISNGGSGTTTIGTDSATISAGTYGKVLSVSLSSAGTDGTSVPTATIQTPPTAYYSYPYTGGTNTTSGTFSDPTVQSLIDDANAEIAAIRTLHPGQSVQLNELYEKTGTQLNIEQRARVNGFYPLPTPRDGKFNQYPTIILSFTDALAPKYSKEVEPHMAAQTLEAISDLDLIAGQSIVAKMRESRNEQRINLMNSSIDNNIPDVLDPEEVKEWIVNGTVGNSIPAYPDTQLGKPDPIGYYDPTTQNLVITSPKLNGVTGPALVDPLLAVNPANLNNVPIAATGAPIVPGSLAGSPYSKILPPTLNALYTSPVLLPGSPTVQQAIDDVITCNCDCWIQ